MRDTDPRAGAPSLQTFGTAVMQAPGSTPAIAAKMAGRPLAELRAECLSRDIPVAPESLERLHGLGRRLGLESGALPA